MQPDFWLERWQRRETGFHLDAPNRWLTGHADAAGLSPGASVFLPLCGKSVDLDWLARRGCRVTGVELSPIAVEGFFADTARSPRRDQDGPFLRLDDGQVRLLCGDFFALDPARLGHVDAVFDRAALVALPPAMRRDYARHLAGLLARGARVLLVSFDYDQSRMPGPPFSVPGEEVHALFDADFEVRALAAGDDIIDLEPRFRARGLDRLVEQGWLLTRR